MGSYGRNFKKVSGNTYRNKKTGKFTSVRHLKASRTMRARYGGTFGSWNKKLEQHYTKMRAWEKGDRDTEPILEYDN